MTANQGSDIMIVYSSTLYLSITDKEAVFIEHLNLLGNGVDGGDEQALQQTYSPKGSASCVQSFDDSLVLQFA